MVKFDKIKPPEGGEKIVMRKDKLIVPDNPIIPFIRGDGIGVDITPVMRRIVDAAVEKAYRGKRRIMWMEIFAGSASVEKYSEVLPKDTFNAIKEYIVAIKGPLTTPVGGGYRSLNVAMRQELDLFACVRPVHWFQGVPTPMKHPENLDVVIFRENTEDVYAGIEWKKGTKEAKKVLNFLNKRMGTSIRMDSGIGVKPISVRGTKRIVRAAINYALANKRNSVTIVHKGNIMKFTEGAFREWGYKLAKEEFGKKTITEAEVRAGAPAKDKVIIKDRIADAMFQQLMLRPDEYDVIVTMNLNGDYLSDACAAQVGGLGVSPSANINYETGRAFFATAHGTAPKYAGQDKVNPTSITLSAAMMLEHIGWGKATSLIKKGIQGAIRSKTVTYDLERQMKGAKLLKCSEFGNAVIENM